jgi:hypothetical protein
MPNPNQPLSSYWYVNFGDGATTGYYAITRWATGTAKTVGQVVRQNATPAVLNERCFVCIVAGTTHATTEPTWVLTAGAKTVDNTVTWMECSGRAGLNGSLANTIAWTTLANVAIPLGTICKGVASAATTLFICTTAGTLGLIEPVWNIVVGGNTADGTAVWTCLGLASNYSAWQNPHCRLVNCTLMRTIAWDIVFVADNHVETQPGNMTLALTTAPSNIYCVDHTVATPTGANLKNTASISITAVTGSISINGNGYIYGIIFNVGVVSTSTQARIQLQGSTAGYMTMENCKIYINDNGSISGNSYAILGSSSTATGFVNLINTSFNFTDPTAYIALYGGAFYWKNSVALVAGSTIPNKLISAASALVVCSLVCEGVDFSSHTSGTLIDASPQGSKISLIKCKLGTSTPVAPQVAGNWEVDLINCDTGTQYFRNEHWSGLGKAITETTVVRQSGAYDGITPISWRTITTTFADWGLPFICLPISVYNTLIGSLLTATIEIISDGLTLTNADIWVEASYFSSATSTLRSFVNNGLATGLSTPVNHATSTATWVTTGLISPIKQKLVVTFTPQAIGFVNYRIYIGRVSATIFVDPKVS